MASEHWQRTIQQIDAHGQRRYDRRHLEVCICCQIAADLKSGDLAVPYLQEFADLREHLLPWEECAALVEDYCQQLQIPTTGAAFVQHLHDDLADLAQQVDAQILQDGEVTISG